MELTKLKIDGCSWWLNMHRHFISKEPNINWFIECTDEIKNFNGKLELDYSEMVQYAVFEREEDVTMFLLKWT